MSFMILLPLWVAGSLMQNFANKLNKCFLPAGIQSTYSLLCVKYIPLSSGPDEFWGGFCRQIPSLSLTQIVNPYQFLGPYDIVLPRPESFKVGHFKANTDIQLHTSKFSGCGKTMS